MRRTPCRRRLGFTLIELLVVIGILVLLAGILIPTISHVRTSVHQSATAARVQALSAAIDNYFHTFNAYPGPAGDNELVTAANPNAHTLNSAGSVQVTGTENLTLGLLGGLRFNTTKDALVFVPDECGKGALGLNPVKPAQRYGPYVDPKAAGLETPLSSGASAGQWAKWSDPAHPGDPAPHASLYGDTPIPEFVDAYSDALPILYMRATLGAGGSIVGASDGTNTVQQGNNAYDPSQIQIYVFPSLDVNAGQTTAITNNAFTGGPPDPQVVTDFFQPTATPPITPANYFGQYTAPYTPRNKGYLLITAGPDRKYMTKDDTINNGSAVK